MLLLGQLCAKFNLIISQSFHLIIERQTKTPSHLYKVALLHKPSKSIDKNSIANILSLNVNKLLP